MTAGLGVAVALGQEDLADAAEEAGADQEHRLARRSGTTQPNGRVTSDSTAAVTEK